MQQGQEVKPIADYMKKDSKLLPYLPYPRFLLDVDLTQTAKVLYVVLLDRANLSRANGWTDEDGNIYIVFPLSKIADLVDKGPSTVKNALNELETAGLIERRRCGNGMPNRIYVKQPDSQDIDRLMDKKLAVKRPENWPADSQKVGRQIARKLAPNKIGSSNLKNNLSRVSESPHVQGRKRSCPTSGSSMWKSCPSTWPPQARPTRTMPPPFAAGQRRIGARAKAYQITLTRRAIAYE